MRRAWWPLIATAMFLGSAVTIAQDPRYGGRSLDAWVSDLADLDPRLRLRAVTTLAKAGAVVVPLLERALDSPSREQRSWALTTLAAMDSTPNDALERALTKPDPVLRLRAAAYLSASGRPSSAVTQILIEALSSADTSGQLDALHSLFRIKTKPAALTKFAAPLLGSADADVRRTSALLLSTLAGEQRAAGAALTARLPAEKDSVVTLQIVQSIGMLLYRDARSEFERIKAEGRPDAIRIAINDALERMK
jgi:hypothetical protein